MMQAKLKKKQLCKYYFHLRKILCMLVKNSFTMFPLYISVCIEIELEIWRELAFIAVGILF